MTGPGESGQGGSGPRESGQGGSGRRQTGRGESGRGESGQGGSGRRESGRSQSGRGESGCPSEPGGTQDGPAASGPSWLLACYPRSWRRRYGPEFAELLLADQAERGRCWRRDADVAVAGLAVWARLAIGLQWSSPRAPGLARAMDLMSAALALIAMAGLLAAAPVARTVVLAVARKKARSLRLPACLIAAGTGVLVIGGRHFQNGWPGTGGHLLAHQGLVPGGLAAFGWAATMWVTSYWAHPAALAAFPAGQLAWMVVSPAATGCLVAGAVLLVRRLPLTARTLQYQARVAAAGGAGVLLLAAGTLSWLSGAGNAPVPLFRPGIIGQASLAVLALAAVAGMSAARQSWAAGRALTRTSVR